jgi:hypothetical protein
MNILSESGIPKKTIGMRVSSINSLNQSDESLSNL